MNDLTVKSVDVLGDAIMAVKNNDGHIYAGVSYFCNALGMTRGQKNRQVKNVQEDEVLKKGCIKLGAGVLDTGNETVALRIDFVPIWLAKIGITDKTKQDNPQLAEKLLNYQLKAKDILAEAFLPKQGIPQTIPEQIQLLAQGNVELNKRVDSIQTELEELKLDLPILPIEADRITEAVKKRGVSILGGKQSPAYNDKGLRTSLYNNLYANLKYNFNIKSYKSIKRCQCDKAVEIIMNYQPPFFLAEQIANTNAQQTFNLEGGAAQ